GAAPPGPPAPGTNVGDTCHHISAAPSENPALGKDKAAGVVVGRSCPEKGVSLLPVILILAREALRARLGSSPNSTGAPWARKLLDPAPCPLLQKRLAPHREARHERTRTPTLPAARRRPAPAPRRRAPGRRQRPGRRR